MPSSTLMSSIPHLQRHTVRELLDNKKDPIPLVDISNDAPVEEALDLLLAGDILTLPVYMTGTESTKKQYIGLISAYDLLHFLTLHVSLIIYIIPIHFINTSLIGTFIR
jgi:CBS domain-containing protein